jgi:hypothetical protein
VVLHAAAGHVDWQVWCFTLPLVMVDAFRWRMVPIVCLTCWALFVIEEIGHIIEVAGVAGGGWPWRWRCGAQAGGWGGEAAAYAAGGASTAR